VVFPSLLICLVLLLDLYFQVWPGFTNTRTAVLYCPGVTFGSYGLVLSRPDIQSNSHNGPLFWIIFMPIGFLFAKTNFKTNLIAAMSLAVFGACLHLMIRQAVREIRLARRVIKNRLFS
jgi:hypothetical protein